MRKKPPVHRTWDAERSELLRTWWQEGKTAREIALAIDHFKHRWDRGESAVKAEIYRRMNAARKEPNRSEFEFWSRGKHPWDKPPKKAKPAPTPTANLPRISAQMPRRLLRDPAEFSALPPSRERTGNADDLSADELSAIEHALKERYG
ncbi:hypothetical protein HY970_00405 [Candidatus Kaiserbacteria bacterium]|nr:hypothetical protein [Candidatus Kaiserbacteria bacterium]